jgi:uncharacterized surface protein with fasciclin (FAS1) repeats
MVRKVLKRSALAAGAMLVSSVAMAGSAIVDLAASNAQFSTLVKAVQAAGLTDTLKGAGPFTVFAPTDAAFAKLPAGELDKLMADPAKLKVVLTYHVLPSKVKAADVKTGEAKTVNGRAVKIKADGGKVMVDKAQVVSTDIVASNGVIYAIDAVSLPKM